MKESIGGTMLFFIVICFVLLFSGIMALTINRSNAYAIKDKVVSIIEDHGYFPMDSDVAHESIIEEIVESLQARSYNQLGRCPNYDSSYGAVDVTAYNREGNVVTEDKASFCIAKIAGSAGAGTLSTYYYEVTFFYNLDIPLVSEGFNFKVKGQTKALYA